MSGQWYYQDADGAPVGPLSFGEFAKAVRAGWIGPQTPVGTSSPDAPPESWTPARDTPAFHTAYRPPRSTASMVTFTLGFVLLALGLLQWIIVDARPGASLPSLGSLVMMLVAAIFFAMQKIIERPDELIQLLRERR